MKKYTVYVDDNFHYMDESERHKFGEYETLEEAISACKKVVERSLNEFWKPEMSEAELVTQFCFFGEDPWISGGNDVPFHAKEYAGEKAKQLTKGKK